MPISTKCPHCAAYDSFPDVEAGKSVSCPACGGSIPLPFKARPVVAAVVVQAKPITAVPVAAKPVSKPAPIADDEDEDRPRKKSKPVVDLDDEEEDRPRKKSKIIIDLDDEADRPRKKKSKPIVEVEDDEDRPRKKKSKAALDLDEEASSAKSEPELTFDDDAEAAPKKKKPRRRDEDDEDDDRPRRKPAKKGGSGKLLLILGGVSLLLLAVCGGGAVYFYLQWDDGVDKGVADSKTKMTATEPTKETPGSKPKVKETVQKVSSGESHSALLTKMGPGTVARISDLEEILSSFKFGIGPPTKADLQIVLDGYAPWVDRGRGLMFRDADVRALIVFSGIGADKKDWKVHGVLWVEQTGNRSEYYERIGFARNPSGDTEAQKLGLKGWKNFRIDDDTGGGRPGVLKDKALAIKLGDAYGNVRASLGRGALYTLPALTADMAKYKRAGGGSSAMGPLIADAYAPWIARECALVWREGNLTVVAAFSSPPLKVGMSDARAVKGLYWLDDKGGAAEFSEPIPIPSDLAADPDAQALGLKPYVDLKEVAGGTVPVVPKPSEVVKITATELAAEVFKDRATAAKKYAGVTLEIRGVVLNKPGTGSILNLKGGTDEDTMKTLLVGVGMKPDQRDAAKALEAGDTVTVTGTLGSAPPGSGVIPIREGAIKK